MTILIEPRKHNTDLLESPGIENLVNTAAAEEQNQSEKVAKVSKQGKKKKTKKKK